MGSRVFMHRTRDSISRTEEKKRDKTNTILVFDLDLNSY